MTDTSNPLSKYFRKPAIYTSIPTQGEFYPAGSLTFDNEKELAVYPMTARDEMIMNTPDALLNGQATVDVIKSCIPGIKDPWQVPIIDLDTLIIGIRIATYGEMMDLNITVPKVNKDMTYQVDLRTLADQIDKKRFKSEIHIDSDLSFKVKPMNYKQITNMQLRTYEQQRLVTQVAESKMSPQEKQEQFAEVFKNMTSITLSNMKDAIMEVLADGKSITDRNYINEFVDNMDGNVARKIRAHIDSQNQIGRIQEINIQTPEDMVKDGAPEKFTAPLSLDNSNFFASKS